MAILLKMLKDTKGASQDDLSIQFIFDDFDTGQNFLKVHIHFEVGRICQSINTRIEYFDIDEVKGDLSLKILKAFPAEYKNVSEIDEKYEDTYALLLNILFLKMMIHEIQEGEEIRLGLWTGNSFTLSYNPLKEICQIDLEADGESMETGVGLEGPYPKDKMIENLKAVIKNLEAFPIQEPKYTAEESKLLQMVKEVKV